MSERGQWSCAIRGGNVKGREVRERQNVARVLANRVNCGQSSHLSGQTL